MPKTEETKLITAQQVQQEYINIDIRRVRAFLNKYCKYRKIGRQYFYVRADVEEKLVSLEQDVEYSLDRRVPQYEKRRRKAK